MKCDECKGSGKYRGLSIVEPCRKCGGVGRLTSSNNEVLDSILDMQPHTDITWHFERKFKTPSELQVGDVVWIYDANWYETIVRDIEQNSIIILHYLHGAFEIHRNLIGWNVTHQRFEYIRSGTPAENKKRFNGIGL